MASGTILLMLAENLCAAAAKPPKPMMESLTENLLTPIPLCFALGIFCKLIHGGIKIPKELYYTISIFLLMSIGFMGGHELALADINVVFKPAMVTLLLGCVTPVVAYVVLRYLGRMSVADSAGIAAHYGSTSAVTFAVAQNYVEGQGHPMNGFLPTLVTILECPGIAIALAIGAVFSAVKEKHLADSPENGTKDEGKFGEAIYEVLTGQSIMLMAGMLLIGYVSTCTMPNARVFLEKSEDHVAAKESPGEPAAEPSKQLTEEEKKAAEEAEEAKIKAEKELHAKEKAEKMKVFEKSPFYPFYQFFLAKGMIFRGALCIFLLEMGLVAGERLKDLVKVGPFLIAFGIFLPLFHGFLGAWLGHWAGLNLGGCTVFAAIVSSASYIAAPPAVRLTLPEANPTLSITAALAITFPFNIAIGIPVYYQMAQWVGAT
jgi:hypothetical protein